MQAALRSDFVIIRYEGSQFVVSRADFESVVEIVHVIVFLLGRIFLTEALVHFIKRKAKVKAA